MVFSSITFLTVFLPLFLFLYKFLPGVISIKNFFILISSIFFYSWGGPKFIFVILGITFLDFAVVSTMSKKEKLLSRKLFLSLSVLLNVSILFYFKYYNFFIDNVNNLLGGSLIQVSKIVLPIGISFFTFESITYSVDVYRRVHKPLTNFWEYQLYIIFFPKLIAGPIVRYHDIADQIRDHLSYETFGNTLSGLIRFCIGLGKKVLIANVVGQQADIIFNLPVSEISTPLSWIGAIAYTLQIYFDFSGYSDMAIGLSRVMGFRIPENFDNPYTSTSITEFWRRWHISLGKWMKNYLYIPLGGNRVNERRIYFNLLIVFLASGLWHGASWNFVFWGIFHGFFLVLDRIFLLSFLKKIGKTPAIFITFIIVMIGWIFFRLENMHDAFYYIQKMFSLDFEASKYLLFKNDFIISLLLGLFFSFFILNKSCNQLHEYIYYQTHNSISRILLSFLALSIYLLSIIFIAGADFNPFIYFRF